MDTASALMGLGLLILFVAPVGYIIYNQSFQEKKQAKKLAFLAHKNGLKLDEVEHLSGLSLGLDKSAGKFILLKQGSKTKLQVIDLAEVKKVEVNKSDEDGKVVLDLDEVREISLDLINKNGTAKKLVFYAEEEDPVTQKEQRLINASKWKKILQEHM